MTKKSRKIKTKAVVEFRKDIVCGEWILVSSLRQSRPHFLAKKKKAEKILLKKDCPFEDPQKSGNPAPVIWYPRPGVASENLKDWFVQAIPNKYPLLLNNKVCSKSRPHGIYTKMDGFGFHEVIITRNHNKPLQKMSKEEIEVVLRLYRERYKTLEKDKCIEYVLIFHNEGELAGATIAHPHSQLVALPVIPPDVSRSINGGISFFEQNKKCAHCTMLDHEQEEKSRIIYKNKYFVTFCPYASRVPYETRIFPLKHSSDFEEITDEEISFLADSMKDALLRISEALGGPDYNFFIHTASAKVKDVPYYHWHIEIYPRTYKWGGMELGTGVEVLAVPPEEAANNLRKALKK